MMELGNWWQSTASISFFFFRFSFQKDLLSEVSDAFRNVDVLLKSIQKNGLFMHKYAEMDEMIEMNEKNAERLENKKKNGLRVGQ